jgi:hypothetical protein
MKEKQTVETVPGKPSEDWMAKRWRPAMGWLYMAVCAFDFIIFPVLWSILQALTHGQTNSQWQPLTLQGAGLFHLAMGAVLGIAAYGRTQEKMAGAEHGGIGSFAGGAGTTYVPPGAQNTVTVSNQAPAAGFGSPSTFGSSPGFGSAPSFGGGRPIGPPPATQPLL